MNRGPILTILTLFLLLPAAALWADDIPNFLTDVKEGEWVLYDTDMGNLQKSTVTKVTGTEAFFLDETIVGDKTVRQRETSLKITEGMQELTPPGGPKPLVIDGSVRVKDREVPCSIVELTLEDRKLRLYMTNDVPVMGLAKMEEEKNGEVTPMLTLLDFGLGR